MNRLMRILWLAVISNVAMLSAWAQNCGCSCCVGKDVCCCNPAPEKKSELVKIGGELETGSTQTVALKMGDDGTFSGSYLFEVPQNSEWYVYVERKDTWIDIVPEGAEALEARECSHKNPESFAKGLRYLLKEGVRYELKVSKSSLWMEKIMIMPH